MRGVGLPGRLSRLFFLVPFLSVTAMLAAALATFRGAAQPAVRPARAVRTAE